MADLSAEHVNPVHQVGDPPSHGRDAQEGPVQDRVEVPPIPVTNPSRDGYVGSVTHADLGASYNRMSLTSARVIDHIVDELQGMYIAYG